MGQKLFNRIKGLRHREKPMAEKGAEGGFSTMLAYQIIKKRGFIEILFAIGCLFSLILSHIASRGKRVSGRSIAESPGGMIQ